MKQLLTAVLVLIGLAGLGQKPFQGTVVYALTASGEKDSAELTVHFTPNRIILKFREKADYEPKYNLVDLDSGKVFIVNDEDKAYRVRKLVSATKPEPAEARSILGYATSPLVFSQSSPGGFLKNILSGDITLYVSKDHFYPLDKRFASNPELLFIQDNHIVLGGKVIIGSPLGEFEGEDEETDRPKSMVITAEAVRIEPKIFSKEDFRIPADYTRGRKFYGADTSVDVELTDSAIVTMDTSLTVIADTIQTQTDTVHKENIKNTPKPAAPVKTKPVKGEAVKRKKT